MENEKILDRVTYFLTVILATWLLSSYGGKSVDDLDWISGMFAGFLMYIVLYIPVKIAVYAAAFLLLIIKETVGVIKEIKTEPRLKDS